MRERTSWAAYAGAWAAVSEAREAGGAADADGGGEAVAGGDGGGAGGVVDPGVEGADGVIVIVLTGPAKL